LPESFEGRKHRPQITQILYEVCKEEVTQISGVAVRSGIRQMRMSAKQAINSHTMFTTVDGKAR
jgi:hypothetical protein